MNLISIILSSVSMLLLIVVIILIKNINTNKSSSLSKNDIDDIQQMIVRTINNLVESVANLIAEKNSKIMESLEKNTNDLNSNMSKLIDNFDKSIKEIKDDLLSFERSQSKLFNEYKENTSKDNLQFINETKELNNKINKSISDFQIDFIRKYSEQKEEIMKKLSDEIKSFNEEINKSLESSDKSLKEKLEDFRISTKESIKSLNENVSKNLIDIREDNNKKLEQINLSVNEKLQRTLEEKLKDSFKNVVEGIGSVNQAVGEIKGLATDVGSLKNVLTNVKTKGMMGEVILGNIIRDFLTPGQYAENVMTNKDSKARVEFAIILPGTKDDKIYLPVDSKFPYESYSIIHESSDIDEINESKRKLRTNLLKYAKDVSEKYIDVPNTTDFAVIFLPLEGLYLEALNMGLFEEIQSKFKVNLTGPTTFTAFISSLNMGFRSLMIQKKSADVFKLLGAVKTEFGKFADALEKTQKKVDDASKELDSLVGTRTRMLNSKLRNINALDDEQTKLLIESDDE